MRKYLSCCLLCLLMGCAYRTVERPVREEAVVSKTETASEKVIEKKAKTNCVEKCKCPKAKKKVKTAAKPCKKLYPTHKKPLPKVKCENIAGVRLYQIFKTFAMGQTCTADCNELSCSKGKIVQILKPAGKIYHYDDVIRPGKGECFVYDGTFNYRSRGKVPRQALRIKLSRHFKQPKK